MSAINRGPYNALVDDDGSNTVGSIWNKTAIKNVLLDPVDAAIVPPVWVAVTYSGANFFGTGTMNWTVDASDQVRFSYLLNGKTMTVSFYLDATTLSGTATSEVRIIIPAGATVKNWCTGTVWIVAGALGYAGVIRGAVGATYLSVFKADLTNYTLSTNNTIFTGTFTFEIT